jgi:hypothetical protein
VGRVEAGFRVGRDLFSRRCSTNPQLNVIGHWPESSLFHRFQHPWNRSIGQLIWSKGERDASWGS